MIDRVIIHFKDHVHARVECDDGIAMEMFEHFTFFVPGYQFMPSFRNKCWDGKIRLFDRRSRQIYTGLIDQVKQFCESRSYEFVDSRPRIASKTTIGELIDIRSRGEPITPRDYQLEGYRHVIANRQALILSPTASGKSLIIYMIMRYFLSAYSTNVLIVVPTTSLVEQMYGDFADYSSHDKTFEVDQVCHRIYSGKEKNHDKRVTITTWQSIHRLDKRWFSQFGMVVGDEAHGFKAKSLTSIMEKLVNAEYRVGTTGTLDGTATHRMVLEGVFGPVYRITTTKKLMEASQLAQLKVHMIALQYSNEECAKAKSMDYHAEIDMIVSHEKRNKFIRNLALDQRGNTLILFNYVAKHGKPLYADLMKSCKEDRPIFFVSGEVATEDRERVREITEQSDNAIIVASMGVFSQGVNIRKLNNLIFASPSKSQIRVLQSIGRGLRVSPDGRKTVVYDLVDDLRHKSHKNYTLNHGAIRAKIYSVEQFDTSMHQVKLT